MAANILIKKASKRFTVDGAIVLSINTKRGITKLLEFSIEEGCPVHLRMNSEDDARLCVTALEKLNEEEFSVKVLVKHVPGIPEDEVFTNESAPITTISVNDIAAGKPNDESNL